MKFHDNFTEANLIFGQPVHFTITDNDNGFISSFAMEMPKFKHIQFNADFQQFVGLLNAPILKLQEQFSFIANFESHYQLYLGLMEINS